MVSFQLASLSSPLWQLLDLHGIRESLLFRRFRYHAETATSEICKSCMYTLCSETRVFTPTPLIMKMPQHWQTSHVLTCAVLLPESPFAMIDFTHAPVIFWRVICSLFWNIFGLVASTDTPWSHRRYQFHYLNWLYWR